MFERGRSHLLPKLGPGLLALIWLAPVSDLRAQGVCVFCDQDRPYGSCLITSVDYPDAFPGSAVVVPSTDGATRQLYLADLFSGRTYIFNDTGGVSLVELDSSVLSPEGSRRTSGVAFNSDDGFLYWAIGGEETSSSSLPENPRLLRTSPDLSTQQSFDQAVEIDLIALANMLSLPQVGRLGDIAVHVERNTFWGVDIVNDIFFEFDFSGAPVVEDGTPVHFRSPARSTSPAAFGNSLTYVEVGGLPFFDIPVGSLADDGVTRIERVYASTGSENGLDFTYGDPAGLYYNTNEILGTHGFIGGIYHWQDTCGADQNAQIVLDFGSAGSPPQIHFVNADTPAPDDRGVSRFDCAARGNNVDLEWSQYVSLDSISVTRIDLRSGEETVLTGLPADATAPGVHTFADERISDGVYEYRLAATTATDFPLPDRICRVTVGRGQLVASVDYAEAIAANAGEGEPVNDAPFGLTDLGTRDAILVADLETARGHIFSLDLEYVASFPGPFTNNFDFFGGRNVGVAYNDDLDEVVWAYAVNGQHFLQRTALVTDDANEIVGFEVVGSPSRLRNPINLPRLSVLGDLAYDSAREQYWAVDRLNAVALSLLADGTLTGQSLTMQVPSPAGVAGGGIDVVESNASTLVLDWISGDEAGGRATELTRVSYIRSFDDDDVEVINLPGTETFGVDLRPETGSATFGGMQNVVRGEDEFQFIVSLDTGRILKLSMNEGITGKRFLRGDANADGSMNISDPSFILSFLFRGGRTPPCLDAADVNDDELVDVSDAIYIFAYMFLGQAAPPEPFQECGFDLEPELPCDRTICTPQ